MDGPAALVLRPLRMSLAPHFLPPWESRSLADFWGLRWNRAASNALRTAIYEPLVQGSLVKQEVKQSHQQQAKQGGAAPSGGVRRRSARLAEGEAAAAAAGIAAAAADSSAAAAAAAAGSGAAGGSGMGGRRLAGMAASFFVSGVVHEIIMWCVRPPVPHAPCCTAHPMFPHAPTAATGRLLRHCADCCWHCCCPLALLALPLMQVCVGQCHPPPGLALLLHRWVWGAPQAARFSVQTPGLESAATLPGHAPGRAYLHTRCSRGLAAAQ
jgi:hypothetical protein